jgi:hypothetical protein
METMTVPSPPGTTPTSEWKCKRCGSVLGACSATKLYIGDLEIREKFGAMHVCGTWNRWRPSEDLDIEPCSTG